jgi:hypothetical protein
MKIEVGGPKARQSIEDVTRKIRDLAESLGQRYDVRLSLPQGEGDKLKWFNDGRSPHQPARPVFEIGPEQRAAVIAAVGDRVRNDLATSGRVNTLQALQAGAQAYRAAWVNRLTRSGGDVRWAPLSPAYAYRKHRMGLDPRTGVATGAMLAAVRAGLVVVRRIG